jgi:hypothetical protein
MRCYFITDGLGTKRYAATNADARTIRGELVARLGAKKKDFTIVQVDISLAKAELLKFINNLCVREGEPE